MEEPISPELTSSEDRNEEPETGGSAKASSPSSLR